MKFQGLFFIPPLNIFNVIGTSFLGLLLMVGSVFAAVFDQKEDLWSPCIFGNQNAKLIISLNARGATSSRRREKRP